MFTAGYDASAAGEFWIRRSTCGPASVTLPPPAPAIVAPTPLAKTATVTAPCTTKPLIRMVTACHIRTDRTREVTPIATCQTQVPLWGQVDLTDLRNRAADRP